MSSGPVVRLPHQPALDGLRAVSVLVVIAYHLGWGWFGGGYLGVEVFFVVSGFLITALLLDERDMTGTISLRQFWIRRARRLLPALATMLVVVAAYAAWQVPDALARLRSDLVASVFYVSNWWQIWTGQGYFDQLGRPPLLRHLWSLAVEEQWYLVFPVAFGALAARVGARVGRAGAVLGGLAVASAVWFVVLADPTGDATRAYVGTDTRASGLLAGSALACVWRPWRHPAAGRRALPLLDAAGFGALALLAIAVVGFDTYGFFLPTESLGPVLYRGGMAAVSLVSLVAIAAAVHPGARRFRTVLATSALQWVGRRSYGLYLWHWPVIVVFTEADTGMSGWQLLAFRVAVTVLATELTYAYVETPIRERRWARRPALAAGLAVALVVPFAGYRLAGAEEVDLATGPVPAGGASEVTPASTAGASTAGTVPEAASGGAVSAGPPGTAVSTPGRRTVAVVGDSQAMTLVRNAPGTATAAFGLVDGSIEGCGLFPGGSMRSSAGFRRFFDPCKDAPQRWARSVASAKADAALVLIGAWDVFDLDRNGTVLRFGTPEHDAVLLGTLRAGIEAVSAAGATTVLLEVPCYRPIAVGGLPLLPERGEDARVRHLNDVLRRVAAEEPQRARFVAGPAEWCADEQVARGLSYRWDGVHYLAPGAQLVFGAITPALQGVPMRA
jgi:peptidoglycan/LPS O-acetylase OafA/YrhL